MTILVPPPPERLFPLLAAKLRNVAWADPGMFPNDLVQAAQPLPLYRLEAGQGLADASPNGWRIIVLARRTAFWVDIDETEILEIMDGPAVVQLVKATALTELASAEGEARVIIDPPVGGGAIWIHGQDDRLWAFAPALNATESSPADLLADWEQRRSSMIAGSITALE